MIIIDINKIKNLVKVSTEKKTFHSEKEKKKSYILTIAFIILFASALCNMTIWGYKKLGESGQEASIVNLIFSIGILTTYFMSINEVLNIFFFREVLLNLIQFPITKIQLLLSNLIIVYRKTLKIMSFFLVPLVTYGFLKSESISFYLLSILSILVMSIVPILIISILSSILISFTLNFKNISILIKISTAFIYAITMIPLLINLIFSSSSVPINFFGEIYSLNFKPILDIVIPHQNFIQELFTTGDINIQIELMVKILAIVAVVFIIFLTIIPINYMKILDRTNYDNKDNSSKSIRNDENSVFKSLVITDIKRILRSNVIFKWAIINPVIMSIGCFLSMKFISIFSTYLHLNDNGIKYMQLFMFNMIGTYAVTMTGVAESSFSREGRGLGILATFPYVNDNIIKAKVSVAFIFNSIPFFLNSFIILIMNLKSDLILRLITLNFSIYIAFTLISFKSDLKNLQVNWVKEEDLFSNTWKMWRYSIWGFGYSIGIFFITLIMAKIFSTDLNLFAYNAYFIISIFFNLILIIISINKIMAFGRKNKILDILNL